jgi:uncharacterized protein (TIGR03435 family)
VYAEGILRVCRFYLESPLPCAAGVTGADLRKRIQEIMTARHSRRLTLARKLALAGAAVLAVAGPVAIGVLHVPAGRAQENDTERFDVASVKPSNPNAEGGSLRFLPGEGLGIANIALKALIEFAYNVNDDQLAGGPSWITSERYDIQAKPAQPDGPVDLRQASDEEIAKVQERHRQRMRALLKERFQLAVRREEKSLPIYVLLVGKNGPRMTESEPQDGGPRHVQQGRDGRMTAKRCTMQRLAEILSMGAGRPVRDRTGLEKRYDFALEWTANATPVDPDGATPPPALSTALQEQLGLKLEAQRGRWRRS